MDSKIPTIAKDPETGADKATLTWSNVHIVKKVELANGKDTVDEVNNIFRIIADAIDAHALNIHLYGQVSVTGTAHNTTGPAHKRQTVQKHITVRISGNEQKRGNAHIAILPDNAGRADQDSFLDPDATHHSFVPTCVMFAVGGDPVLRVQKYQDIETVVTPDHKDFGWTMMTMATGISQLQYHG
ncbi:uncharacterized protein LACBIDRAFT_294734 [Laccaria bicolor S238N-H82]|uniref:Predicted protein n=1 Tax=Laccaria bicolor (strain S238N-H82 / ATCC MYA-4686) TaxID=486041 RepID=B0DHC9_LACBS|nr:uncharacterized protein LACBIDRAFT_294734 [Laccaria bicolor S238N-H82]EDR05992.1 predicted protein [Laccaria bicolor S238N-H82]|eukprot:XP_001883280.1 predicted protein [Laccaria bicolor S238N-H82]